MSIILFDKVCIYDNITCRTIIYGQYNKSFDTIEIKNANNDIEYTVNRCPDRPDFYIAMMGEYKFIDEISFYGKDHKETFEHIDLEFPFLNCDLNLQSDSCIITTICKQYTHRLIEWIEYNLRLGFSGIIIFNNDGNTNNGINESLEYCVSDSTISDIQQQFKSKVWIVNFPYSPLPGYHWNNLQRITLNIGVNQFLHKCHHIALIDADEFIYLPQNNQNIQTFLEPYRTITMRSNILTNKNNNDIINNNVLQLCKYIGENKYTKTILYTEDIKPFEFITTPHEHPTQTILDKNKIIHYHCWVNKRYRYKKNMPRLELNFL